MRMSRRAFIMGTTLVGAGIAIDQYEQILQYVAQYGISAVAAGQHFSLAIRDGRVYAWGKNDVGQCNVPRDLPRITQISAAENHIVALSTDGEPFVWGGQKYTLQQFPRIVNALTMYDAAHAIMLLADDYQTFYIVKDGNSAQPVVETYKWPVKIKRIRQTFEGALIFDADNKWSVIEYSNQYRSTQIRFKETVVDVTNLYWGITIDGDVAIPSSVVTTDGDKTTEHIITKDERDYLLRHGIGIDIANMRDLRDIIRISAVDITGLYSVNRSGYVTLWTGSNANQAQTAHLALPFGQNTTVRYLVSSGTHALALTTAGELYAWGDNTDGACDIPRPLWT